MESIRMQSISNDLYTNLRDLLYEIETTGNEDDPVFNHTVNELKKIHNVLVFMRNSYERSLISITGLQGSGKTTVINQLYDLDSNALPENPGRGEVKPVLITEKKNLEAPQAFEICLHDDGYTLEKHPITNEELHNQSMSPSPKTLWFELEVPFTYTMDEKKSIVLLPGFENEKNHLSQEMLEYLLNMSDRAVLVVRKDSIANESNANMIDQIKHKYGDINPLIIMSFGDINPETNSDLMTLLMDEMEIEEHQLVCKNHDRDLWIDDFLKKIDSFNDGNSGLDQRKYQQLSSLSKEIRTHVNNIDTQTKKKLSDKEVTSLLKEIKDDRTLIAIQAHKEKILNEMRKQLKHNINPVKNKAIKEYKKYVVEKETREKAIRSMFKADALDHAMEYEEKIEKIWSEQIDNQNIEQRIYDNATSSIIKLEKQYFESQKEQESELNHLFSYSKVNQKKLPNTFIDSTEEMKIEETIYGEQMINITEYFNRDIKAPDELNEKDIATLAIMATAMGRQLITGSEVINETSEQYNKFGNMSGEIDKFKNIDKAKKETKKKINKFELNAVSNIFLTRSILKGIPVVLGVDAAVDGELTLLGNASEALNAVGISISAKALLGWIGVGLITLKSLESLHLQTVKLNGKKINLAQKGEELYENIANDYVEGVITIYRDIFDLIEQRYVELQHTRTSNDPDYNSLKRIIYISNELKSNAKSFAKEVKHEKLLFEPTQ